jgi:CBS domain containing-hemolysin-like protein
MRQLARKEQESPGFVEALMRRLRGMAGKPETDGGLRETLEELIEAAEDSEARQLHEDERELLLNALAFGELRVDDVMVPRADIKGVPETASLPELVAALRAAGHSRLVIYRGSLDDVQGMVSVKDLLGYWGKADGFALADVMRPVLVVPPSMRVLELLLEMRDKRLQMAVVVDEFGGTDGLVTLEDLVEELVGELQDEHEKTKPPQIVRNADGTIDVDARAYLEDLQEELGIGLVTEEDDDEADTLGGLVFTLLDRVPAKGEVVRHPSGLELEVIEADPRRVKRVRIHRGKGEARIDNSRATGQS